MSGGGRDVADGSGRDALGRSASDRLTDLLATYIAQQVRADPSLIDAARTVIERTPDRVRHASEWRQLLDGGVDAVVAVLTSTASDGRHLRSHGPLARVVRVPDGARARLVERAYEEQDDD